MAETHEKKLGYEEARRRRWTNAQWLRYRGTGYTPEDMAADELGALPKIEKKSLYSMMTGEHKQGDVCRKEQHFSLIQKGERSLKDFIERFNPLISAIENISTSNPKTLPCFLEDIYLFAVSVDNYGICFLDLDLDKQKTFDDFLGRLRVAFDDFVNFFEQTEDPVIRSQILQILFKLSHALPGLNMSEKVDAEIDKVILEDVDTLGKSLEAKDYFFAIHMLSVMSFVGNKNKSLPCFWNGEHNNERIPDDILLKYGEKLLSPIINIFSRIIDLQNLDTLNTYSCMGFLKRLVRQLKDKPDIVAILQRSGIDFQKLADKFTQSVVNSHNEDYPLSLTSDRCWRNVFALLEAFYEKDTCLNTHIPNMLDEAFLEGIIDSKRPGTGECVALFARSAGIDLALNKTNNRLI